MREEIRNNHVLIIGSGQTLRLYIKKIRKFIKKNEVVTIGCNNMAHIIIPDYHIWGDKDRYSKFGKKTSEQSILIFGSSLLSRGIMKRHRRKPYKVLKYRKWGGLNRGRKITKKAEVNYKNGVITGPFRNIGTLAIFYAHLQGASKISIVGMDGYTLHSKEELNEKKYSQHCYGKGFSDFEGRKMRKKFNYYKEYLKKDKDVYRILYLLKKYGVEFKIITPTVFEEFYDLKVL